MTEDLKIAVLGAGLQGTTVALELARRGCRVDLFDRADQPITQAGLQNEGKLHLGFVYGKDPSLRTTQRLAAGSLRFLPLIRRWTQSQIDNARFSRPFLYAVPHDSLLSPEAVAAHFQRVEACVRQLVARDDAACGAYPGVDGEALFRPLSEAVWERSFSRDGVAAAFVTREIAVEPRSIATMLRVEVQAHPRIQFVSGVQVDAVAPKGNRFTVGTVPAGDPFQRVYDQVVNALWDGRLRIDRGLGLIPDGVWLWRYKVGLSMALSAGVPPIASVTFMLGPYGDTVQYADGQVYLNWYPAGLLGLSSDLTPPPHWKALATAGEAELVAETFAGLERLYPDIRRLRGAAGSSLAIIGGVIFAWGETDIDDPDSRLHQRSNIGVTSVDGYHSVNTGKYCMAPALAMDVADRIMPDPSPALA